MKVIASLLLIMLLCGCQGSTGGDPHDHSDHSDHAEHREPDEHGEEGFIVLTPAQKAELKLTVTPVVEASGQNTGLRPGRIEADPDNRVILSSQTPGTLQRFYTQVGARVSSGDLVALITSPEVTSLQAEYHEAEVEAELARKELANKRQLIEIGDDTRRPIETARVELAQAQAQRKAAAAKLKSAILKNQRLEKLLKDGIASGQQVEESRAQRQALEAELEQATITVEIARSHLKRESRVAGTRLRSNAKTFPAEARLARAAEQMRHARERLQQLGADPHAHDGSVKVFSTIDGVVVERPLTRGELVTPGQPLAVIIDASNVWVWVDLQRSDLAFIGHGAPIELSLVDQPDLIEKGRLDYLAPKVDEKTQTVKARVVLTDPRKEFRLGSFVNARLSGQKGQKFPAIPQRAIQFVEGKTVIYVQEESGYRRTPVTPGSSIGEDLVTAEGLEVGSKIVVEGVEQLKSLDLADKIGGHNH